MEKNTPEWKEFERKKNPSLGEEDSVRESIDFSQYANPLNKSILSQLQEGVSDALLLECLADIIHGKLKLNKVCQMLKLEKKLANVKCVIARKFGEHDDMSTHQLQQILGPQLTTDFLADLANQSKDLIKTAQKRANEEKKRERS
eukprot:g9357.t1